MNAQGKDRTINEMKFEPLYWQRVRKEVVILAWTKYQEHINKVSTVIPESSPMQDRYNIPNQTTKWTKENDLTPNRNPKG